MPFEDFYAFNSTKLRKLPLPAARPTDVARKLDTCATERAASLPGAVIEDAAPTRVALDEARQSAEPLRAGMVGWQERLDWTCYRLYGLLDDATADACLAVEDPPLKLGERAFEIALARRVEAGETSTTWFQRHRSTPITKLPAHWSDDYKAVVEARLRAIDKISEIRLIEKPEFKRRWNDEPWEKQEERALERWLLRRLEQYFDLDGRMSTGSEGKQTAKPDLRDPTLISIAKLADLARQDEPFMQVGEVYREDPAFDVQALVAELVEAESVPLLPVLRYKPAGMRKRVEWEKTWELQRQEDAIDARTKLPDDDPQHLSEQDAARLKKKQIGDISVPPKYKSSDFLSSTYWRLRGKLDVPKERWVSFPHCEGSDGTLMIAWAGYDHLQLAKAIGAHYADVQERLGGEDDPRLMPLLACLDQLVPWLKQWHNDVDPQYNVPMGDYFEGFVTDEARRMGLTLEQVRAWQPPKKTRGRKKQTKKKSKDAAQ